MRNFWNFGLFIAFWHIAVHVSWSFGVIGTGWSHWQWTEGNGPAADWLSLCRRRCRLTRTVDCCTARRQKLSRHSWYVFRYVLLHKGLFKIPLISLLHLLQIFFLFSFPFSASILLVGGPERHPACKKLGVGLLVVTIWLELCTSYSSSYHHYLHYH